MAYATHLNTTKHDGIRSQARGSDPIAVAGVQSALGIFLAAPIRPLPQSSRM
jgi:hypothetical protein